MPKENLSCVVLAGGAKHRSSDEARVMMPVHGVPLLGHVLKLLEPLERQETLIVAGEGFDAVSGFVGGRARMVRQREPLGSGQAVGLALEQLAGDGGVLIVYGDRIFLKAETLKSLLAAREKDTMAVLLSVLVQDPAGYARLVRGDDGRVLRVTGDCELRQARDFRIREVVAGAYWFDQKALRESLPAPSEITEKYNLTLCVEQLLKSGGRVAVRQVKDASEARGVYSEAEAAAAELKLPAAG